MRQPAVRMGKLADSIAKKHKQLNWRIISKQ